MPFLSHRYITTGITTFTANMTEEDVHLGDVSCLCKIIKLPTSATSLCTVYKHASRVYTHPCSVEICTGALGLTSAKAAKLIGAGTDAAVVGRDIGCRRENEQPHWIDR